MLSQIGVKSSLHALLPSHDDDDLTQLCVVVPSSSMPSHQPSSLTQQPPEHPPHLKTSNPLIKPPYSFPHPSSTLFFTNLSCSNSRSTSASAHFHQISMLWSLTDSTWAIGHLVVTFVPRLGYIAKGSRCIRNGIYTAYKCF